VTDLIPSCTIAWILVVTGGRSALTSSTPADELIFSDQAGVLGDAPLGSPLADRRAFAPPELHLRPGNTLWDDDGEENRAEPGGVPASLFLRERRGPRAFRDE